MSMPEEMDSAISRLIMRFFERNDPHDLPLLRVELLPRPEAWRIPGS
jgi:hypothetical protein